MARIHETSLVPTPQFHHARCGENPRHRADHRAGEQNPTRQRPSLGLAHRIALHVIDRDDLDASRKTNHHAHRQSCRGHVLVCIAHLADVSRFSLAAAPRLGLLAGLVGELRDDHRPVLADCHRAAEIRHRSHAKMIATNGGYRHEAYHASNSDGLTRYLAKFPS